MTARGAAAGFVVAAAAALACGPAPTPAAPEARLGAALAGDPASGELVLFGGRGRAGLLGDTWVWAANRWRRVETPIAPAPRAFAAAAPDGRAGVLLFGGDANGAGAAPDDTWRWDGRGWSRLRPATVPDGGLYRVMSPGPGGAPVLVIAGADRRVRTWTWAQAGSGAGDWRPAPGVPPWRDAAAMAWERSTGRALLFGGVTAGGAPAADTWAWDGSVWSELEPAHRPAGGPASMAGGDAGPLLFERDGTWAWTGADWTPLVASGRPPWGPYPAMAAVPRGAQPVILFAGAIGDAAHPAGVTWRWSGSTWTAA